MKRGELQTEIEYCLKKYPDTRNSDITLTIKVWEEFHSKHLIMRAKDGKQYVSTESLYEIPREDNIKRIRAKFQNDLGLYLPTIEAVARKRRINEEKWRDYMRNFEA